MTISCGIDFGTSNSSIAIAQDGIINLVPVEDDHVTIPSALFFPRKQSNPVFGRAAAKMFFDKKEGRYMRSLKRVLGTALMKNGTSINGKAVKFEKIISAFLQNIHDKANAQAGEDIGNVVMGRPVHFIDNDPEGDKRAQNELEIIAKSVGFKNVYFQYEPIAAAFAHEVKIAAEKLAIVADLGGGTSDFTIIRLSNKYIAKTERTSDILANTGVRVGGNDFDKDISLTSIMPELGYKSTFGEKNLEVPVKLYHDLAEWSKVNFLYTPKIITQARQLLHQSHDKKRFARIITVLEKEMGHALLASAEETKIALTSDEEHAANLDFLERDFFVNITRQRFEDAIQYEIEKISNSAVDCIKQAGIKEGDIQFVILTGGSTEVPAIQSLFRELFPNASIADDNKLSSVGLGLAYDSYRRFK
ncbi:Hsp70 family protein [Fulvivirgaceae bacterium PWU20]|uniref:Hsp70 family protein n=2 Tax=Chryseosolibacter indicus TaxID=2782351 RepID=A0ABS5VJX2_9BACT|nr:Hsp70 family protein [Chryseosolibacter indicus]